MKIHSSLPMIDQLSRHQAEDHQKAERLNQERRAQSEDSRARDSSQSRTVVTPQEQEQARRRAESTVNSSAKNDRPNFYRFKDTSDFPSRTQRALNTYQDNQASSDRRLPQGELVSNIDTFA